MEGVPLPIPLPLPGNLEVPAPVLAPPTFAPPTWEPIPTYREDVQPTPNPGGKDEDPQETEESQETRESKETKEKPSSTLGSGKIEPPLTLVPELAEVQTVTLPLLNIEVPVPRAEILATAATTAGVSSVTAVTGTLFATTLFRRLQPILKPIFKTLLKKLAKIRKKAPPLTYARERLKARHQRTPDKKVKTGG